MDARLTVWRTPRGRVIYVQHCRLAREGCRARIATFARWIDEVASDHRLDPFILAAMALRESGLNPLAEGGVGERGIVQLHPRGVGRRVRFVQSEAYRRQCSRTPGACQREVLEVGADLLARAMERCGTVEKALGAYNSGVCNENDYTRRVLRERDALIRLARAETTDPRDLLVD